MKFKILKSSRNLEIYLEIWRFILKCEISLKPRFDHHAPEYPNKQEPNTSEVAIEL